MQETKRKMCVYWMRAYQKLLPQKKRMKTLKPTSGR